MTINDLDTAIELMDEIGPAAVGYAYRRRTGQTLYAVFTNESYNDLSSSPDVVAWALIHAGNSHNQMVELLNEIDRDLGDCSSPAEL